MRQHVNFYLILAAVVMASLAIALCPSLTTANPQTLVRTDPPSLGLRNGSQGTISVRVEDVQNMYGMEFHLSFDPNVVEVVDADPSKPGIQIQPGDWLKNSFAAVNKADNTTGKIDYAVTLLNPAPSVSGSGIIATITFKAKADGTSPLKIDKAILATRQATEIKADWQDGAIGVSLLGQAPSVQQSARPGVEPSGGPSGSPQLSSRDILSYGIAGLGVVAFLGALALGVVAVFIYRRK